MPVWMFLFLMVCVELCLILVVRVMKMFILGNEAQRVAIIKVE